MHYLITNLCPRTDIEMSRHGFCIYLAPAWKDLVAASQITQVNISCLIANSGRAWLDACGYDAIYDPDNSGYDSDPKLPPGPDARPLYEPQEAIRVSWGEWGPEHITVPSNACGLDMDDHSLGCPYPGGRGLTPHNIDSWSQKQLLLIVFTTIAEHVVWRSQSTFRLEE